MAGQMTESHVDDDWAQHFQAGVDAYASGKYQADNPHPNGEQAAWEWLAGWNNAREEEMESDFGASDFVNYEMGGWDTDPFDYGDEAA